MDPNETLKRMRDLAYFILNEESDAYDDLAMFFEDLDEWLSKGGFLPDDWK